MVVLAAGGAGAGARQPGAWLAWSTGNVNTVAGSSLATTPPPPPPPRAPESGRRSVYVTPGDDYEVPMSPLAALRTIASKQWPWVMLGLSTVMLAFVLGTPSDEEEPCLLV